MNRPVNPEKLVGYSQERQGYKIKAVLLTHLWRVTALPTGSYDNDDILTETPQGPLQHHCFAGFGEGQESSPLELRRGKSSRGR